MNRDKYAKKLGAFFFYYLCGVFVLKIAQSSEYAAKNKKDSVPDLTVRLVDEKWDQIQKGQWLIGFFDKDTKESMKLEEDWQVFALKCKEQNINVAQVFAPQNPGLYVRFLVTVFPKVFYVKNGVAHEVKQPNRENLVNLIKDKKWSELKPVNFLSNPFSVQMSLLSHLFVHAVNLYNYEDAIVQKFIPFSSATDVTFAFSFIVVGTVLGLLLTCAFGLFQVMFLDTKYPGGEEALEEEEELLRQAAEEKNSEEALEEEEELLRQAAEEKNSEEVEEEFMKALNIHLKPIVLN